MGGASVTPTFLFLHSFAGLGSLRIVSLIFAYNNVLFGLSGGAGSSFRGVGGSIPGSSGHVGVTWTTHLIPK